MDAPVFDPTPYDAAEMAAGRRPKSWRWIRYWGAMKTHLLAVRGFRCETCGLTLRDADAARAALVMHHVVAIADGGQHSADNLQLICGRCHEVVHPFRLSRKARPQIDAGAVVEWGERGPTGRLAEVSYVDLTTLSDEEAATRAGII